MEIDDSPEMILSAEVQGIAEQVESFRILRAVLEEHLFFVDGNAHMVKTPVRNAPDIVFGEKLRPVFSTCGALGQPVGDIHAPMDFESLFLAGKDQADGSQCKK
jgi:hypothetical protein